MSGLLQNEPATAPIRRHGAEVWHVHGKPYRHSAAKFWSSLLDEIAEDFPTCDRLVLESCDGAVFRADLLFPELDLEEAARAAAGRSLADCLRSVALEMEVCGYPSAVAIRLFARDAEILARDLPLDCVDGDLLPHLAVWLLEWAGLPETSWNDPVLAGFVAARDRRRGRAYAFDFELLNQPLHEGLMRRRLTLILRSDAVRRGVS
jgi:hypothetical protein